jgi:hypothetical protein
MEGVRFELDPNAGILRAESANDRLQLGESALCEEMIVLHHHHIEKAEAMIRPAASDDRCFFQCPQPGRCLARIENTGAVRPHRFHIAACEGCDAGEALEEIEGNPLGRENRLRGTIYFEDGISGDDRHSGRSHDLHGQSRVNTREDVR